MHYPISQSQRDEFEREGVILLPQVLTPQQLEALQQAADQSLSKSENYFHRLKVWQDNDVLKNFCLHTQAPEIIAQLISSQKINLFYDQVFTKEPETNTATPWHNDQPYWPVRGSGVVTLWLALDDIGKENGAMEFIAGSNNWDHWYQPFIVENDGSRAQNYPATDDHFVPLPDFDSERDQHRILCWDMQAGDALAFHALTVHGAKANTSSINRRRGYAIRYAGEDVTYYEGPANNPRLINSQLNHGDSLDSKLYPVATISLQQ